MTQHEHWEELAAAFALDALEPDERMEFVGHLVTCEQCRDSVDEHSLVAAQLGSLAAEDALEAPSWSAIRAGIVGDSTPPAAATAPDNVVAFRRHRRRLAVLGAAAAVAAAVIGVTTWQLSTGSGGPEEIQALSSISACQDTEGCHVVALRGNGKTVGSLLAYGRAVSIVAPEMPSPPAGSTWALWQVPREGAPQLMAEFAEGDGVQGVLGMSYADTAGFAVSSEPVGAIPARPSAVVASGTVSA
jgi:anti-sigma-K factor RskA